MKMKMGQILMLGALLQAGLAWAEPTLDQVYQATRSGQLSEAQSMMQEVLRAHPNSAKAHFVEAEVLARSGDLTGGRSELALAQKLQPGLPFAAPSSVSQLQAELNHSGNVGPQRESSPGHTPWGTLLVVGGLALLLVVWLVRRQSAQSQMMAGGMGPRPMGGYYNNGMGGMPPGAPMGGGGGGLMSSLATGAALGAGMVAGEALAHRLVDGPEGGQSSQSGFVPENQGNGAMGGQDFGVNDAGSWDSGGGSDWSSGDSGGGDWT